MSNLKSSVDYKILVVDDTKTDRELFRMMLKQAGYTVDAAESAEQAIAMLEKQNYDLVCCDYMMPGTDGEGFLKKIREMTSLQHLIVIIVTSDESEETKVKLLRAGANDFIHKGSSHDEVKARVRTHLTAKEISSAKAMVQIAGGLANEINQPLSVMITALDLLKEKIEKTVSADKREQLLSIIQTLNLQADRMASLTENIRKLDMDPSKHYRLEKLLM